MRGMRVRMKWKTVCHGGRRAKRLRTFPVITVHSAWHTQAIYVSSTTIYVLYLFLSLSPPLRLCWNIFSSLSLHCRTLSTFSMFAVLCIHSTIKLMLLFINVITIVLIYKHFPFSKTLRKYLIIRIVIVFLFILFV